MSALVAPETIELMQIDLLNLRRLAGAEPVDFGATVVPQGALPPPKVAMRSLAQLEAGTQALWCVPFLIVPKSREAILGGCRFKSAPVDGSVEISYGVAPSQRGRGIASMGVGQLLQLATSSGIVQQVIARILPDNVASSKVVDHLGFVKGHSLIDSDGEEVVQWTWRLIDPHSIRRDRVFD